VRSLYCWYLRSPKWIFLVFLVFIFLTMAVYFFGNGPLLNSTMRSFILHLLPLLYFVIYLLVINKIDTNLLLKNFFNHNARRKSQNIRLHSYVLGLRFLSYLWRIYKHPWLSNSLCSDNFACGMVRFCRGTWIAPRWGSKMANTNRWVLYCLNNFIMCSGSIDHC